MTARLTMIIAIVLLLGLFAGAVLLRGKVRGSWEAVAERQEAEVTRYADAYCEAVAALGQHPFFTAPRGTLDAAPVLTPLVRWEKTRDGGVVPEGTLSIPPAFRQLVADAGVAFMDRPVGFDEVDLSFFGALHDSGRWNLLAPPSPLTPDSTWHAADAPMPRYLDFLYAARLHLRRSVEDGGMGLPAAAQDVQQLAWLLYRTDTLLGAAVASSMLDVEGKIEQHLDAGVFFDQRALAHFRLLAFNAAQFYGPLAPDAVFQKVLACDPLFRCLGLYESLTFTSGIGGMLEEPYRARWLRTQAAALDGGVCTGELPRHWAAHPLLTDDATAKVPGWVSGNIGGLLMGVAADSALLEKAFGPDGGVKPHPALSSPAP